MSVFDYKTIENSSEGVYKEKGSKFLAFAFPVMSEADIKERLSAVQKKYFDARHHCYAWILGADKSRFRAFDDGEPNHSAGDPILGQLRSRSLTDVLVIVVRYFGGVKLGVGGLVTAYKAAAQDALDKCVIIEKQVMRSFRIRYPYPSTTEVMKLVKEFDLQIVSQVFDEACMLDLKVKLRDFDRVIEKINLLSATGTQANIEFEE